jgi:hypothetical protein
MKAVLMAFVMTIRASSDIWVPRSFSPKHITGFRQLRWFNGAIRKHRSRQRRNRPLQVLLHPVTAVAAFSARSKEMATMAAALS